MAQVYNKLLLDVYEDGREIVTAVQNDTQSRYLDIVLTDGSTPIDLTGHEVRIYGVKPEGGGEFFNNGEITDPTAGRCQFELTTQVLAKVGNVKAQIVIYYDNVQILTTREFTINVVKSLISDSAIESSNEYGAVVTLFQDVYDMREVITEMDDRLGPKDSDSTIEGNSDGLFSLANIAAKINRIMNYLVTQSTAGIVETVNAILGRIGAHDSVSDETVMGKLNEINSNTPPLLDDYHKVVFYFNEPGTVYTYEGVGEITRIGILCNFPFDITNFAFTVDGVEMFGGSGANATKAQAFYAAYSQYPRSNGNSSSYNRLISVNALPWENINLSSTSIETGENLFDKPVPFKSSVSVSVNGTFGANSRIYLEFRKPK